MTIDPTRRRTILIDSPYLHRLLNLPEHVQILSVSAENNPLRVSLEIVSDTFEPMYRTVHRLDGTVEKEPASPWHNPADHLRQSERDQLWPEAASPTR